MTIWKLCEYDDILPWSLGFLVYDCYDERAVWRSKYGPLIGWAKRGGGRICVLGLGCPDRYHSNEFPSVQQYP